MKKMENNINERAVALQIILKTVKEKEPINTALARITGARNTFEKRSRAFITQLVYGTLENFMLADHLIGKYSSVPVKKLHKEIKVILEMAVYQLVFLKNIPVSAVCDESVKLAGKIYRGRFKGFVNAVLRSVISSGIPEAEKIPGVSFGEEPLKFISIRYSIPEWIVKMWAEQMVPEDMLEMVRNMRESKGFYIRCNTFLSDTESIRAGLEKEGVSFDDVLKKDTEKLPEYVLKVCGLDSFAGLDSFRKGMFYVQDISSVLSGLMYDIVEGDRILDICAAPGGKSINAALILKEKEKDCNNSVSGRGTVLSCDISEKKLELIRENADRLRLDNISFKKNDGRIFDHSMEEGFDIVIADVPCSGLGIIGKKPDIVLNASSEKIKELINIQRGILCNAYRYVKPGGRLIFSTCTVNKGENEENVSFLEKKFKTVCKVKRQILPGIDGDTDGFFTAVFEK